MKITRKQLRRLIAEAIDNRVPVFSPVTSDEIESLRQAGREHADLSSLSQSQKSNLSALGIDEPNVERNIFQALGSEEPDITVEEEEDFLTGQIAHELQVLLGPGIYNVRPEILKKFRKGLEYPTEVWFMNNYLTNDNTNYSYLEAADKAGNNQKYPMLEKVKEGVYTIYSWGPTQAKNLIDQGLLSEEQEELEEAIFDGIPEDSDISLSYLLYRAILHYQPNALTRSGE